MCCSHAPSQKNKWASRRQLFTFKTLVKYLWKVINHEIAFQRCSNDRSKFKWDLSKPSEIRQALRQCQWIWTWKAIHSQSLPKQSLENTLWRDRWPKITFKISLQGPDAVLKRVSLRLRMTARKLLWGRTVLQQRWREELIKGKKKCAWKNKKSKHSRAVQQISTLKKTCW